MQKIIVAVLLCSVIFWQGCDTTTATTKTNKPAEKAVVTASAAVLEQGKSLYSAKCQKCHELFAPSKFNAIEWRKYVNIMAPKAGISDAEREAVFAFVASGAKK